MAIAIESLRKEVEERFVGFSPVESQVKPVHVANGLFRSLQDSTFSSDALYKFVLTQNRKGEIPVAHSLNSIFETLSKTGKIVREDVREDDLGKFRDLLKKVVSADNGVFFGGFDSYSAGASAFVTKDRVAQSGGELCAEWLIRCKSPLSDCIVSSLKESTDTISGLCAPLISEEHSVFISHFDYDKVNFLNPPLSNRVVESYKGLVEASESLSAHLNNHPNKLYRLRLSVLFASVFILRHLAMLEAIYVPHQETTNLPWLVDFSDKKNQMVHQASQSTYLRWAQSVSRFYGWAFGEILRNKLQLNIKELRASETPTYKSNISKEARDVWELACNEPSTTDEEGFLIFGNAIYDMLALQAEGHPFGYLRQLGSRSGLLDPPVHTHPNKRFHLQQDTLEMLIRGAVGPRETVTMSTLLDRLWERFGVIVGSRSEDQQILLAAGIYQFDNDALNENKTNFAKSLQGLDFARTLADGVLQVNLGA